MMRPCPHCAQPAPAYVGRDHLGAYLITACPLCGCATEVLPAGAYDQPQPITQPTPAKAAEGTWKRQVWVKGAPKSARLPHSPVGSLVRGELK